MKTIKCFNCGKQINYGEKVMSPDGEFAFCSESCWENGDADYLVTSDVGFYGFSYESLPWKDDDQDSDVR